MNVQITRRPRDLRYTRIAIYFHWSIAVLIILNLALGIFNWDFGHDFTHRPENRPIYGLILIFHISAGLTVLLLTVARVAWRLIHHPPAFPASMKRWEVISAHFAHFLLYAAMILAPLTGWAIVSANPPPGSEGAKARQVAMAAQIPAMLPTGQAATDQKGKGGPPPGGTPPPPQFWWVLGPIPMITPLADIGTTKEGYVVQKTLHDEFAEWHAIAAWLTILLLAIHIAGALKHQFIDKERILARMGLGKSEPIEG